ncbi:MAG: helix-turn-helix transcriptional regulator [Egibacteraceae bacterium]
MRASIRPGWAGRLVGRRDELAVLNRILSEDSASARVVEIVGEPGMGKTRLLAELRRRAEQRGRLVLAGRATEFGRGVPFGIAAEMIDDCLAALGTGHLERFDPHCFSLLGASFPARAGEAIPAAPVGYPLYRAVRMLLQALAEPRGLVIALDDVHWADAASVELLEHLLRHPPRAPTLVAVTYRPRQAPTRLVAALADAGGDGLVERLELCPLTVEEAGELLGSTVSSSHRRTLYQGSGGNPLYLKALAAARRDPTDPADPAWSLDDALACGLPVPMSVALRAGFDALTPIGRVVAQAAAVLGDPFEPELAAEVAGVSPSEALAALDDLVAVDLVRPTASSQFCYRHPLVRRVVYHDAGAGWRVGAHARAATALATRNACVIARARHLERAGHLGDEAGIGVLVEAAQLMVSRTPALAARWLRAALRLLADEGGCVPRRLDMLVALGRALAMAGQLDASLSVLREALRLPADRPSPQRVEAVVWCARVESLLGRHREARALLVAEVAALLDERSVEVAVLKSELASVSLQGGDFDLAWAEEAMAAARCHHDLTLRVYALGILAMAASVNADIDRACDCASEARLVLDELPDNELAQRLPAIVWVGWSEASVESYEQALDHFNRGLCLARETGCDFVIPHVLVGLASVQTSLGRLREAAGYAEDAVEAARLLGSDQLCSMALTAQARVALASGDTEAALMVALRAVETAGTVKDPWWRLSRIVLAEARVASGGQQGSVEAMVDAGHGPQLPGIAAFRRVEVYEALVRAELAQDHDDAALRWADRAEAVASGLGLPGRTGFALLARAEALAATDVLMAGEHALAAAAAFSQTGHLLDAGRAHRLAGAALAAAGGRRRALAEFEQAATLFDLCGAPRLADQVVREQEGLTSRARHEFGRVPEVCGLGALSSREFEVAALVSKGLTNRQIARTLSLSPRTVETYLERVFVKFGASSRAEVASRVGPALADPRSEQELS